MAPEVILAMGPVDDFVSERLSRFGQVIEVDQLDRRSIDTYLPDSIAIAARAMAVIDAGVITSAPRLRVIARSGVGVDRIDLAAATARRIPVVITPDAGTRAVAEGALALILHLVKRLGRLTEMMRAQRWEDRESLPVGDLDGATLGIVGYGRIGRRLGEIAAALGMQILVFDPLLDPGPIDGHTTSTNLKSLVGASDVVSLHAPLTPQTKGMIDADLLGGFKTGSILVNCARGGLVDLGAVYDALESGRLSGVGLDVYADEPPPAHPLFNHPDVVLTPHVLGLSKRARRMIFEAMAKGIEAVLTGGRAPHVANPEVYEPLTTARRAGQR